MPAQEAGELAGHEGHSERAAGADEPQSALVDDPAAAFLAWGI